MKLDWTTVLLVLIIVVGIGYLVLKRRRKS